MASTDMTLDSFTTVCCETTANAMWLLLGSGMITAGVVYARMVIHRLTEGLR